MLRLYHAFGKASISVSRLMSYLKDADPMSIMAEIERKACTEIV
jgi:hypothetical protein